MQKLCTALAEAFAEFEGASKSRPNPAFRSKYADLSAVIDAIKPALVKHGLFYSQATHDAEGGVCVETIVSHSSGEQMSFGKLFVPASKRDPHGYGSALTYARRYSLMTAFGIPAEDDDGNKASEAVRQQPRREPETMPVSGADVDLIKTLAEAVKKPLGDILNAHEIKDLKQLTAKQATNVINRLRSMEVANA